ncbi:hypothetical protein HJB52_14200 [Rhizobium lentis]|uniref:hypothetical protein n=1 Tax=Rhizobium lentis TaxID=1138194 RepID=UPI001C836BDE|nr:hypothetical protein [Rhizobium lentis]MBX5103024.1 hypothetical protein [Rhizobium lentis]
MNNHAIPEKTLQAGKSAYAALIDDEATIEACLAEWQAMSSAAKVQALSVDALRAHPALADKPLYLVFTTCPYAREITPSEAAIVPKCPLVDSEIPRVKGYLKILSVIATQVDCRDHAFVAVFLRDVAFQSCRSTDARYNRDLGLFERYGVRSVDDWRKPPFACGRVQVSRSTFFRMKDQLVELGLIDAEQHLKNGKQSLWIKATEKLNMSLFDEGYWKSVCPQPAAKPQKISSGRKPRGISARHLAVSAELSQIYNAAMKGAYEAMPKKDRWAIFERLTQTVVLSGKVEKLPFAPKGSYRFRRLYDKLNLAYSAV